MSLLTKMQFKLENLFNRLCKLIPSASGKILYNKWILYFIFVVGIYDVVHFYQRGNSMAVAIFFIVGFLTSFFSKNMIVIIVSAIAVSHIVAYGNKMTEGFEEKDEEEGFKEDEEEEGFEEGVDGEESEEAPDDSAKNLQKTISEKKEAPEKKEASAKKEEEPESFNGIEKMLTDMNKILAQTEAQIQSSKQDGVKQGFTTMGYSEYR
jgi:hypothetical protein